MANERYSPERAVAKLRQTEVLVGEGKSIHLGCKEAAAIAAAWGFPSV